MLTFEVNRHVQPDIITTFVSENILVTLHEGIVDSTRYKCSFNIIIKDASPNKIYDMIIDTLYYNFKTKTLTSKSTGTIYNLSVINDLTSLTNDYDNFKTDKWYLYVKTIHNIVKNSKPVAEPKKSVEVSECSSQSSDDSETTEFTIIEPENRQPNNPPPLSQEEIDRLREEYEQEQLLKRQAQEYIEKRAKRLETFKVEKTTTYPMIYEQMFVTKKIDSWNKIPIFFVTEFPIYLYMDGRNTEGEVVRERLLDREDEFEIFEMLYSAATDDNYELPDDPEKLSIIEDFMATLPPITIMTRDDVMSALNELEKKKQTHYIFNETETPKISRSNAEEKKGEINVYQM